jgi:hypothetical protein
VGERGMDVVIFTNEGPKNPNPLLRWIKTRANTLLK